MTTEQTIALNRLVHSTLNVRRTGKLDGIGELAASIAAHGLRQNLNVLPSADGRRFAVVAGARRLRAMQQLVRAGRLPKDAPVPCLVLGEDEDAAEISLAENAMRSAMHPDDQFEAFRALIEDKDLSVEEVAARFGVTPAVVRQRLKLAHVSPQLRALFRAGEMSLHQVMALAISDDHAAQETAWQNLPDWNRQPAALKEALTGQAVAATDRLARFIEVEAYLAAGGTLIRDLFDEADAGYLTDRALVLRLATDKLTEAAAAIQAEGWKWVRPELVRDHSIRYGRIWPVTGRDDDSEDDDDERAATFAAADKARAGVLVRVGPDGSLQIDRGLIDPADLKAEAKRERGSGSKTGVPASYTAALVADLTAQRTAALRIELARNPVVALAVTVHALACQLLRHGEASCLALRAESKALDRYIAVPADSPAQAAMQSESERWTDRLPASEGSLMAWCLTQPQEVLLDLLAYLASLTIDAVQQRPDRLTEADALAKALKLDMTHWWTPSVEGFCLRLPKAALIAALGEAGVTAAAPFDGARKSEAARMTAKALHGTGWLPAALRNRL